MFPGGLSSGANRTDPILTKPRKYVELCDGPIYPDFEYPPDAMLSGEEGCWASRRYGQALGLCEYPSLLQDTLAPLLDELAHHTSTHQTSVVPLLRRTSFGTIDRASDLVTVALSYSAGYQYQLDQLAAIHGLYYLSRADSEDCRLDLIDSHHLGIRGIDGECRPDLVAVQGALASAHDRNWTNLALFFTRTPPFGDDVANFPPEVQKFAELGFYFAESSLCGPSLENALCKSPLKEYICS
jgi:hypothetical protein